MKTLVRALAASLTLACGGTAAHAATVLDQNNQPTNLRFNDAIEWQQQVTVGISGQLEGITLFGGDVSNLVRIAIGGPFQSDSFVFSQTVHLLRDGLFIDTSAAHIVLKAGESFVIDVSGGTTCCFLRGSVNPYAGGRFFEKNGNSPPIDRTDMDGSLAFQTFVNPDVSAVPEPLTWALLTGGLGMAGAALRRRRASLSPA